MSVVCSGEKHGCSAWQVVKNVGCSSFTRRALDLPDGGQGGEMGQHSEQETPQGHQRDCLVEMKECNNVTVDLRATTMTRLCSS